MSQTALDLSAFTEMKDLMGDAFNDIVTMCLESLPDQLNAIETAIADNDAESLFAVSHKMKSGCGSIGAFGLAEKAETVEVIGRGGSTEVPEETIGALRDAVQEVIAYLTTVLSES